MDIFMILMLLPGAVVVLAVVASVVGGLLNAHQAGINRVRYHDGEYGDGFRDELRRQERNSNGPLGM